MTKLRTTTTALLSLASPVWCFTAEKADLAAAAACSATDGDACVEEADAHALLSLRASHVKQRRASTCPGSNKACSGNQCCDGIPETHGKTFPCPDAEDSYHDCAIDWALCYDKETRCVGNQCCPRIATSENKTYPCPGADRDWNGCETGEGTDFDLVARDFHVYPGSETELNVKGTVRARGSRARVGKVDMSWLLEDDGNDNYVDFINWSMDPRCTKGAAVDIPNGCGIHIHEGKTCETAGGHYWQKTAEQETDPWLPVKYVTDSGTWDDAGLLGFASNDEGIMVNMGYDLHSAIGRTMVVHDYTGARVACSIIQRAS